jgi:hypothetical protein
MRATYFLAPFILVALAAAPSQDTHGEKSSAVEESMPAQKIRITVGEEVLTATLNDSKTSLDFLSLLPLTLTLEDYEATEKISMLPRKLTAQGAPAASDPTIGDIAYYAPWGNLAIYYKDFESSPGLIVLGKLDGDLEALRGPGPVEATIEVTDE